MKTILAVIGFVAFMFISSTWYGYVLSIIWGWFIAPTFGIAYLSVPLAIGISSAVRLVTWQHDNEEQDKKPFNERMAAIMLRALVVPSATLFFCWIVKHWI
jgi:hypothetical protein